MLRLSRLTDYGLLVMTQMASRPADTHTARDLAVHTHLPQPTVSKVLKVMTRAGLLVSHRGVAGGYALARKPEEIGVPEIVAAIEGPIALMLCAEGPGKCDLEDGCSTHGHWVVINRAVLSALEDIRLSDLAQPARASFLHLGSPGRSHS